MSVSTFITDVILYVLFCVLQYLNDLFQVPIIVPILVLLFSCYLVVAPIVQNPRIEFLYASLFMFSGLVFYVPFVVYKKEFFFMSKYC
jgi:L-type amino acid transporter 9